jgi:hypothetical protein
MVWFWENRAHQMASRRVELLTARLPGESCDPLLGPSVSLLRKGVQPQSVLLPAYEQVSGREVAALSELAGMLEQHLDPQG